MIVTGVSYYIWTCLQMLQWNESFQLLLEIIESKKKIKNILTLSLLISFQFIFTLVSSDFIYFHKNKNETMIMDSNCNLDSKSINFEFLTPEVWFSLFKIFCHFFFQANTVLFRLKLISRCYFVVEKMTKTFKINWSLKQKTT